MNAASGNLADWQTYRLATLFREVNDAGEVGLPILSVSIHHGISDRELDTEERDRKVAHIEDRTKYKRIQAGDLVYNMMRAWQGAFGMARVAGLVSPAYIVARPTRPIDGKFFEFLLRSPRYIEAAKSASRGITDFRLRLYWEHFRQIRVRIPDLEIQKVIADFLDRETARIDILIEKKQRLIALLGDRNQREVSALLNSISHEMRSQSLRWLVHVRSGDFISNDQMEMQRTSSSPVPVVGGNGVMAYASRSNSPEKTVVVGRVGALCGNVHFIEDLSWITDNALIVRPISKQLMPEFLVAILRQAHLNEKASKSAQPLITGETVKSLKVRVPRVRTL